MANQRETKLPNIYRNPLIIMEIVNDIQELIDDLGKQETEASPADRRKIKSKKLRLRAFNNELERNAEARIGGQLDD
jgi:hypothetical protein